MLFDFLNLSGSSEEQANDFLDRAVSRFYEYWSEEEGDDWMRESTSLSKIPIPDRFNKTNPRLFIPASSESQLQSNITPICFEGINPINERIRKGWRREEGNNHIK